MDKLTTSIEPKQERILRGLFLSFKEPVEECPATVLVHGDIPGEMRDLWAPWLSREEPHLISLLLILCCDYL
jgi:hypothetical protein